MSTRPRSIDPETDIPTRLKGVENFLAQRLPGAIARAVKPIVSDLQTTINDLLAASYYTITQTQSYVSTAISNALTNALSSYSTTASMNNAINSKVASPGAISPTSVASSGTVSGPTGTFNTALNSSGAYSNNITATRAAVWISNAGSIGVTTSSERFKQDIVKADLDPLAILKIDVDMYHYKAEIAKRDDPTSPDYVGPDYHVHTEIGMIAERLHEAGMWPFVIYEREDVTETHEATRTVTDDDGNESDETYDVVTIVGDRLKVDAAGNPIPFSIHYDLWALAVHVATQHLATLIDGHEDRIAALERAAGITS